MIAYYASQRHFVDHLAPIHKLTGGTFHCPQTLVRHAAKHGIRAVTYPARRRPMVVASYGDMKKAVNWQAAPLVLVNHGAGQTFLKAHGSYSGGPNRGRVSLFIEPNETTAQKSRDVYPDAQVAVVGSPKLDRWHGFTKQRDDPPTVALSFHWNGTVVPETQTAWPHWRRHILPMLQARFTVLGHGHPKIMATLEPWYRQHDVEVVRDFDDVMRRADLYICDGVSTLYEFAATDRPVVVLNAPWFRKDVEHGLRFWRHADVGVQCDQPSDLDDAIDLALDDAPRRQALRREAVAASVGAIDGAAAQRAADAIDGLIGASDAG